MATMRIHLFVEAALDLILFLLIPTEIIAIDNCLVDYYQPTKFVLY